jgi:hypothetical protein
LLATPPDTLLASWRDPGRLEFLDPHREIINRLQVVNNLRRTFGVVDLNVKVREVAWRLVVIIAKVGVVSWVNPDDALGGDPRPMVDAHPRGDVEFDGHSIGPFREYLKETLINKLIDLCRHGIALADVAHCWAFRLDEKMSLRVDGGGWANGV